MTRIERIERKVKVLLWMMGVNIVLFVLVMVLLVKAFW
jgi:hypothetical protein